MKLQTIALCAAMLAGSASMALAQGNATAPGQMKPVPNTPGHSGAAPGQTINDNPTPRSGGASAVAPGAANRPTTTGNTSTAPGQTINNNPTPRRGGASDVAPGAANRPTK